ncbi:MAG: TolC family protein [Balneolaceae bacterium]
MKSKILVFIFFVLTFGAAFTAVAQDTGELELTLQQAVERALEENHQIIISRNLAEVDAKSATRGNAGYLPTLSLNSSYSESMEDSRFEFSGGENEQDVSGSRASNLNASVEFNWVLFDGLGNRYRFESLQATQDLSSAQTRQEIEGTLLDVITRYLDVTLQSQLLDVSEEAVEVSAQRYSRARQNYDMGGGSQVDLLNAEVDLNSDSIRVAETELALNQAKRNLLVLIGESPAQDLSADQEISLDDELSLDTLLHSALSDNSRLSATNIESERARLQLQQSRAARYPELSTQASYNYNRRSSDAGQFTFQETDGFTAGVALSFNIFDGFRRNIEIQNNEILLKNSREQYELVEKEIESALLNAYDTYTTNLLLYEKQELNIQTAEVNFDRTRLAFEQGQVSNTDFREAQLNLLEARQELISRRADAKLSEIELLRLAGKLLPTSED